MRKVVFSTDQLPAELDAEQRFASWNERYSDLYCAFDQYRGDGPTFSARFEFRQLGGVKSSRFKGTLARAVRTSRHIAGGADDTIGDFTFTFNRGHADVQATQGKIEGRYPPGALMFFTDAEPSTFAGMGHLDWAAVTLPRQQLVELVADPGDFLLMPFDPNAPAIRHLSRYLDIIHESNDADSEPALDRHIETTLLDLAALALGARRDAADRARTRGLRAARLQAVLAAVGEEFSNPTLSSNDIGLKLGISPNYIQKLLHETGTSFTERVLELRLQKARAMLSNPRYHDVKVIEIAYSCGFNEVSYFNRCFRRRFGAAPNEFRGRQHSSD